MSTYYRDMYFSLLFSSFASYSFFYSFFPTTFLPLLPFASHTLTGLLEHLLLFSLVSFTFLLSLHEPFDVEHFFLCSCCLQTLVSQDLSSISPACRGLSPCPEGFLSMGCCAELNIIERRRQAGTRWPGLRKQLRGEQIVSAASRWPSKDTIHRGIICLDSFAQLQVSWDPCLETTAVIFLFWHCEVVHRTFHLEPNRPLDGGTKPNIQSLCTSHPFSSTYWCFSSLVSKMLL